MDKDDQRRTRCDLFLAGSKTSTGIHLSPNIKDILQFFIIRVLPIPIISSIRPILFPSQRTNCRIKPPRLPETLLCLRPRPLGIFQLRLYQFSSIHVAILITSNVRTKSRIGWTEDTWHFHIRLYFVQCQCKVGEIKIEFSVRRQLGGHPQPNRVGNVDRMVRVLVLLLHHFLRPAEVVGSRWTLGHWKVTQNSPVKSIGHRISVSAVRIHVNGLNKSGALSVDKQPLVSSAILMLLWLLLIYTTPPVIFNETLCPVRDIPLVIVGQEGNLCFITGRVIPYHNRSEILQVHLSEHQVINTRQDVIHGPCKDLVQVGQDDAQRTIVPDVHRCAGQFERWWEPAVKLDVPCFCVKRRYRGMVADLFANRAEGLPLHFVGFTE